MNDLARQDQFRADAPTIIRPATYSCTIPAFVLSNAEHSVSTIVAEYPLTNNDSLSIARPFQGMTENPDTTYIIAVRYTDTSGNTFRYVLFDGNGAFFILYPAYAGQVIGESATIEIWANKDDTTIIASADIVFSINTITPYGVANTPVGFCSTVDNTSITLTAS